jgi:hypothetical protein
LPFALRGCSLAEPAAVPPYATEAEAGKITSPQVPKGLGSATVTIAAAIIIGFLIYLAVRPPWRFGLLLLLILIPFGLGLGG